MPKPLAIRLALAAVALVAAAWFALLAIESHDISRASSILSGNNAASTAQINEVPSLLSTGSILNPDRQIELLRGQLALSRGQKARALGIFAAVTRAEPQNVLAWDLLALAGDTPALRQVAQLEPPVR